MRVASNVSAIPPLPRSSPISYFGGLAHRSASRRIKTSRVLPGETADAFLRTLGIRVTHLNRVEPRLEAVPKGRATDLFAVDPHVAPGLGVNDQTAPCRSAPAAVHRAGSASESDVRHLEFFSATLHAGAAPLEPPSLSGDSSPESSVVNSSRKEVSSVLELDQARQLGMRIAKDHAQPDGRDGTERRVRRCHLVCSSGRRPHSRAASEGRSA